VKNAPLVVAHAAAKAMKTSRSATVSIEFCVTWGRPRASTKPSALAVNSRSIGSVVPAIAPEPRGHQFACRPTSARAFGVAIEHLHPREQVMREEDGLGPLEMGVAGDEHVALPRRQVKQGPLGAAHALDQVGRGVFEPEPHVGRHLVVPTARGMKPRRRRHALGQRVLNVHVHILQFRAPDEGACFDFREDDIEPLVDRIALGLGDQAHVGQHGGVRLAARDVEMGETRIKRNAFAEAQHELGRSGGEASAPGHL
jgi:hypothetical protein